ncbi:MAG: histidine triad nucleotide-binding protein [Chloroflexi bacterium]|nr:histidine triad nucleotide-binding protein [Chloroflexota bacterium]
MATDCVFCKIVSGEIKTELVHQDGDVVAFRDIHPRAPVHVLVVPRDHVPGVAEVPGGHSLIGHMVAVANLLAKQEKVAGSGYRLVVNQGPDSGQEVRHLHMHLLGGKRLGPMG